MQIVVIVVVMMVMVVMITCLLSHYKLSARSFISRHSQARRRDDGLSSVSRFPAAAWDTGRTFTLAPHLVLTGTGLRAQHLLLPLVSGAGTGDGGGLCSERFRIPGAHEGLAGGKLRICTFEVDMSLRAQCCL